MAVTYHNLLLLIKPQYTDASGRTHENVTWWTGSITAGYSAGQLNAIGGEFNLNWQNAWAKIGATNATYDGCIVQDYTGPTGLDVLVTSSAPGNLSSPAPINAAVLISLQGSTRYRGGHGRIYLPSLGETITSDGVNVNTALTAWGTFLTDFAAVYTGMAGISGTNGGPVVPVINHQRRKSEAPYLEDQSGYVVNTKLATQRRRLRKAAHR